MKSQEFKNHIKCNLIPFWDSLLDEEHGGFYGYVDFDGNVDKTGEKGVILNSRILWFYSTAYRLFGDKKLLEMADHAYEFLTNKCIDSRFGGVYWSLDYKGEVKDSIKHTYNQAFAIYALSAYYDACKRTEALTMAYVLFNIIEEKCRDKYGYLEAFNRDFTPASNEKLSENGVMAERTMNTLLHVIEAYTELYRVDGFDEVSDALKSALDLFRDRIYNTEKKICDVFFDKRYNSLIDLESYGHDIEASWLIDRALLVLGDEKYNEKMGSMTDELSCTVYDNAIDRNQFALNNERENDVINTDKIWWMQAEAVIGFYNSYEKNHDEKYRIASEKIWKFINESVIDKKTGEWYEIVKSDGTPVKKPMVQPWKCPYHNGRMCMEMICRIEKEEALG